MNMDRKKIAKVAAISALALFGFLLTVEVTCLLWLLMIGGIL
jgi:hypothetical protein